MLSESKFSNNYNNNNNLHIDASEKPEAMFDGSMFMDVMFSISESEITTWLMD